ncbi:TPA: fimbrial protein [Morganella morganii]|nr:fimbrial protein [Morganella morganii]HAT1528509.1 fimbrial protein [Morganella morganii]HDF2344536.1 fimbrial-like protein [Morganella morganii]
MVQFSKPPFTAALFGVFTLMMSVETQAATSASTEFTATIAYEGACAITTSTGVVIFNNGDAVLPSQIEGHEAAAQQTFELTLSDCHGFGVTPKITLAGLSNTDTGMALYLDTAASTTTGYGILLATDGNDNFASNTNLAANKVISVNSKWNTQTDLTTLNGSIPLTATLSCGKCSQARIGGDLVANITFEFQYD